MARFHVAQDETGRFQLTYENDSGELALVSYDFDDPKQLVEDAIEMAGSGRYGQAIVVVDPARREHSEESVRSVMVGKPAPRRAGQ